VRSLGGIVQNVNAGPGNVILGKTWATIRPPAMLVDRIGFLKLQTSPGSFLQANLWTARRIYETALAWAAPEPQDAAIDLFCGVGPLSLHLATRAARVFAVEESEGAIRDARSNQRRNGFHNLRFEAARAEEALPRLRAELGRVAVVTLNPPRKGVVGAVLEEIAALGPDRIVYVSCDPETLARDLDRLATLGYRPTRALPFDMLPQTEHVEVVALLER
jgi:23S rRNA (uracil1939-C5)-methyltransferase